MKPKIAIFDYGAGNLFSLKAAVEKQGAEVEIVTSLSGKFDGIILPGVGNFDPAIRSIRSYGKQVKEAIRSGVPMLGICLGMEMLFEKSEEGRLKGLGVFEGEVVMLPKRMKIPHMGWNNLVIKGKSKLLEGIKDNTWVYFVHSYRIKTREKIIVAESEYGIRFPAVIEEGNLFGTQFHPEKSGEAGERILKNFVEICKQ